MPQTKTTRAMERREFLLRGALPPAALGMASALAGRRVWAQAENPKAQPAEWRNKQPDMPYRRLGRTNFMISEVVCGGDPISHDNHRHVEFAIDMGLNYLDMASQYRRGETEEAYGKVIKRSSMRERVFMNTKISTYSGLRNRLYKEIFDGLPSGKQEVIVKRVAEMRREQFVDKPGYFIEYFANQARQLGENFRSNAMMRDYRHKVEGSPEFRRTIIETFEGSLRRTGTDYFDIVMCPHGACSAEELEVPEIYETFLELKRQGKVRFLGVSSHNNPAAVLRGAVKAGHYDVVMMAYNLINGGYLEAEIRAAKAKDIGIIAMKVANPFARRHRRTLEPIPEWRVQKLERIVPGEYSVPQKAYIWALQNPNISAVISDLWDENYVKENLAAAGKQVVLAPA